MADYAISNVPRRVVYANTGVGPYAFTFEILANTDIAVYRGSTLLTLTTDYSVTINSNGTGSVTLVTAGTGNITIVGARAIQRTSDYTTGGDLFASTLNTDLDSQTIYVQQVAETAERGLKAPVVDPTDINMTLPSKTDRAGTFLAFDSPSGNPIAGPSIASVGTVTQNIANINTVATNIASVNTVAGNISNVNTVAGISGNVTTVANNNANITTVADDLNEPVSEINTVATNITNVNTVGNNIANVNTVAGISANVTSVAGNATNINTVAGSIANVDALGPIAADITTVAGIDSDVTAVAADATDIGTVAGNIANVNTVAGISANVTSVASNSTNINTVATNIANVNSVATNIANVNSVAGNATNINAVAGNSTNINTVAGISSNVTTVATNNANVTTVAGSIANVNTNATNIANINQNAANITAIQNASANATAAANSATAAAASATSASNSAAAASAVALGNEPVRHSVRPSLLLDFANTKTLDPRITFTRASTGTFYDGKTVAKAEENLLLRSQELDNASWTRFQINSVTANSDTAPDGTTTADLINVTAAVGSIFQTSVAIAGTTASISIFAKAGTASSLKIDCTTGGNGRSCTFDLSAGTAGSVVNEGAGTNVTGGTATITSVGNGWYRCSIANLTVVVTSAVGFVVTSTGNMLMWGAQLEQRSSVTAYTATTTAPITNYIPALQTAASGVARFEHNPVTGESLGLEIEEQRTNLVLQSQFASGWTTNNSSITTNTIVAPDGTLTGAKLVENTATSNHAITQSVSPTGAVAHTLSVYAKAAERGFVVLEGQSAFGGGYIWFNLTTGAVGTTGGSGSPSGTITSVGNGWYRCTLRVTANGTTASNFAIYSSAVDGTASYAGNGFSGIYIWGAQLEAGAFATSYIKTEGSQVTRSADYPIISGANYTPWARNEEFTAYSEFRRTSTASNARILSFQPVSGSTPFDVVSNATNGLVTLDNTFITSIVSSSVVSANSIGKVAGVFKRADYAISVNGATASTSSYASSLSAGTELRIGCNASNSGVLNGTIAKVAYYPKRLTNAELAGLSTV